MIDRLTEEIEAVCPIYGVSVGTLGNSATGTIHFKPEATNPQRSAAQNVLTNFDWTQETHDDWLHDKCATEGNEHILNSKHVEMCGTRAYLRSFLALLNPKLVALGQTSITEAQIETYMTNNPDIGKVQELGTGSGTGTSPGID